MGLAAHTLFIYGMKNWSNFSNHKGYSFLVYLPLVLESDLKIIHWSLPLALFPKHTYMSQIACLHSWKHSQASQRNSYRHVTQLSQITKGLWKQLLAPTAWTPWIFPITRAYTHTHTHTHTHTYTQTHTQICTCMLLYTYAHTYTCAVKLRICKYTHIHTYLCTLTLMQYVQ